MERKYPNLCKPIRIGNVWYRNRMFSTPMGGTDIELDGCIGPKATYAADAIRRHGAIPSAELSHSDMFAGTYMTDKDKSHGLNQW